MINIEKLVYSFKKELIATKYNFDLEQDNRRHIKEYYFHIMENKVDINYENELETVIYKMVRFYIINSNKLIEIIKSNNQINTLDTRFEMDKKRVIVDAALKIINNGIDDTCKTDMQKLYMVEREHIWQMIKDNSIIADQQGNNVNIEYELYVYVICLLEK